MNNLKPLMEAGMQFKKSFLSLLFIPFLCVAVQATTIFQIGIRDLAQNAEKIVPAKVTAIVTQWNARQTIIFTYVRMNIVDDHKRSQPVHRPRKEKW